MRYIELLKNDRGNLLILLLQVPIIALLLLIFIRNGIGTGGFDPGNVVQCPTTAQVLNTDGFPAAPDPAHPITSTSCTTLENYLRIDPEGKRRCSTEPKRPRGRPRKLA